MSSHDSSAERHGLTNAVVHAFLHSNLSLILILLAVVVGLAALAITPREEDPQIVVPLADIYVSFPGHSAAEVEQLIATPLEKILYQIDGVEYVYSMSREGQAVITVRYYVGEDRERSLVKLYKKIDENLDIVPPGTAGWVIKPVEIDDVPIVTLTLTSPSADDFTLRRVAEELSQRLAAVPDVSRSYVVGGRARVMQVYLDPDRMEAYSVSPLEIARALQGANVTRAAGAFTRDDRLIRVEAGRAFANAQEIQDLVVGVFGERPVFLKDVAASADGPTEATSYVRHAWGPARGFAEQEGFTGTVVGSSPSPSGRGWTGTPGRVRGRPDVLEESSALGDRRSPHASPLAGGEGVRARDSSTPAVTVAIAKKKGANAVRVAQSVLAQAGALKRELVPDDIDLVITRNYGLTADEKVNDLIEALAVAIFIVIALLTMGLGWRESLIVAVAVPVVFGLTLAVNLLFGFTINRVTLFALILSLGLLVDDPIVDVENISRHFKLRKKASRKIVLEAVSEIRPPLITATLAVIVSFLPMFFITGMMGPYMRPMALNVPVAMLMSMVVAFTITPWLTYHVLKKHYSEPSPSGRGQGEGGSISPGAPETIAMQSDRQSPHPNPLPGGEGTGTDPHDLGDIKKSFLYRLFYPLMAPMLHSKAVAWGFLLIMGVLMVAAMGLAAARSVPLKMLPFDNKNELLLVLDFDEGTTLERSDAVVRQFEELLQRVPEVTDITSYVGAASPMDFNGLVRHYYLRQGENVAEVRVNLVGKKNRDQKSHAIGLRLRDELTALARKNGANLKIVETPPGPPVIASVVAEIYGRPDHTYADLQAAARTVRARMEREPGVVDVDDSIEAKQSKLVYVTDKEKAALNGVTVADVAVTIQTGLSGATPGTVRVEGERHPLLIELRLPRPLRSSAADLSRLNVKGQSGQLVSLAEIGRWEEATVDQTIYHKNLQRVVYVFAETAGRPPADCVVDIQADKLSRERVLMEPPYEQLPHGWVNSDTVVRPVAARSFVNNGGRVTWWLPDGFRVDFAGEGEWKITLDVFRDLGLAFGAALVAIYILLVAQTGSFVIPGVVMLAIPLTVIGVMPGFWLLNKISGGTVGGYSDSVFFTATGMIGMIALAGIVTRDSIILVDFIHLSLKRGRSLFDAIMESRVVRLRPILLTAAAAMLSAIPIAVDPIFSGLAWALIFGLFASTVFTLFVIPVTYWLLYANKPGHGLPLEDADAIDKSASP